MVKCLGFVMNGSGWVKLDVIGIEAWLSKASKGSQSALCCCWFYRA